MVCILKKNIFNKNYFLKHLSFVLLVFAFNIASAKNLNIIKDNKSSIKKKLILWQSELEKKDSKSIVDVVNQFSFYIENEDLSVNEYSFTKKSLEKILIRESKGETSLRSQNQKLIENSLVLFNEPLESGESALDILKQYFDNPTDPKTFINQRAYVAGNKWEAVVDSENDTDDEADLGKNIDRRLIELELGLIK